MARDTVLGDIIPVILPDEVIDGYRGRIAGCNGLKKSEAVTRLLCEHVTGQGLTDRRPANFLEAAALANRLTFDDFVARHTCYAISNLIGRRPTAADSGDTAIRHAKVTTLHARAARMALCPVCVKQDLKQFRFAYWRRRHQIAGQILCHAHACGLQFIERIDQVSVSPAEAAQHARSLPLDYALRLSENPFITCAIEILDKIVEQNLVLDLQNCQAACRGAVLATGEDPSAPGWFSKFSARMDDAFGFEWLARTCRRAKLRPGEMRTFAFGAFGGRSAALSHTALAVVAGLLFPSASAAIAALLQSRNT